MAFELKRKETVPDGIRRVACERMEKAVQVLDGNGRKGVGDEAVHEARKQFKQVRGALRMVRKDLGGKKFDRENRTLRQLNRAAIDSPRRGRWILPRPGPRDAIAD
jgi:hypothetical protein